MSHTSYDNADIETDRPPGGSGSGCSVLSAYSSCRREDSWPLISSGCNLATSLSFCRYFSPCACSAARGSSALRACLTCAFVRCVRCAGLLAIARICREAIAWSDRLLVPVTPTDKRP